MKFYLTSTSGNNVNSKLERDEINTSYATRIDENFYDVTVDKDEDGDWVLDVENLDDLVEIFKFLEEDFVMFKSSKGDYPVIEIYDDYRE